MITQTEIKTKTYAEIYNEATQAMLHRAKIIDDVVQTKIKLKYKLQDITYVLRELYKDPNFRMHFVGPGYASGPKWSKGMCARASAAIYDLYGGNKVWGIYSISLEDWPLASVTFLRDKFQKLDFGTTGEHFYPQVIPYDLGMPIDVLPSGQKTAEFIQIVKKELDRR